MKSVRLFLKANRFGPKVSQEIMNATKALLCECDYAMFVEGHNIGNGRMLSIEIGSGKGAKVLDVLPEILPNSLSGNAIIMATNITPQELPDFLSRLGFQRVTKEVPEAMPGLA